MLAPNGARLQRAAHPAVPLSSEQLAETAQHCVALGVRALHLHVRDEAERHSLDPWRYHQAIKAIRSRIGETCVLQVSTEAAGQFDLKAQCALLDAGGFDAASIAVREFFSDPKQCEEAANGLHRAHQHGIAQQYILYSLADVQQLQHACVQGWIPVHHPRVLLVLGRHGDTHTDLAALPAWLAALPAHWQWMLCAFGSSERRCLVAAAALGGAVRLGFENSVHHPDGRVAHDNLDSLQGLLTALKTLALEPASWSAYHAALLED